MKILDRINRIDRIRSNPVDPVNLVKRFDFNYKNYICRYRNAFIPSYTLNNFMEMWKKYEVIWYQWSKRDSKF